MIHKNKPICALALFDRRDMKTIKKDLKAVKSVYLTSESNNYRGAFSPLIQGETERGSVNCYLINFAWIKKPALLAGLLWIACQ